MADSKSKKSITLSGDGSLGSSIATGGNIANMRYQNQQALPTEGESEAKMYSEISKNFSRPGDRPRGLLNNAASGIAEGLAHGSRMKDVREKKGNYDKYENVMSYLQEANNSMIERNEWHEEKAMEMEQIKPFATAGLEISYSGMDYQTGNERMRNVMEQAKLSNPNIKGDYVGYVPNTPIVNMRDQDGNITAFSLSSVTGEDVVKRVQGNYIDQQKATKDFQLRERELEARYPSNKSQGENEYGSVPLATIKQGGGGRALMNTVNSEINLAKDIPIVLEQLDEAERIINENPKIGSGWNNYLSKGATTKAYMDQDLRVAYEKLSKIASRVEEAYVKAKGSNITDAERETIRKGLFDTSLKGESSRYNINSIRHELAIAQERGNFASEELANGRIATSTSFNKFMKSKENIESSQDDDIWNTFEKISQ